MAMICRAHRVGVRGGKLAPETPAQLAARITRQCAMAAARVEFARLERPRPEDVDGVEARFAAFDARVVALEGEWSGSWLVVTTAAGELLARWASQDTAAQMVRTVNRERSRGFAFMVQAP